MSRRAQSAPPSAPYTLPGDDVTPQRFVTRTDLACGSTIGPITAAGLGMRVVDVGNPMLSMHSCRELSGAADVGKMIAVLRAVYAARS